MLNFTKNNLKSDYSPITPKRVFCLLITNFQTSGRSLNEFAQLLHNAYKLKTQNNLTFESNEFKQLAFEQSTCFPVKNEFNLNNISNQINTCRF